MKNFKLFAVVLICFTLQIVCVASRNIERDSNPPCNTKSLQKLYNDFNKCAPSYFNVLHIFDRIAGFRNQTLNTTGFNQCITEYCSTVKSATSCSLSVPIHPDCYQDSPTQHVINMMRIISRVEKEYCSKQIIYDIATDSGFGCFENNQFEKCRNEESSNSYDLHHLDDAHICSSLQIFKGCAEDIYNKCGYEHNGKILKYFGEAWTMVNAEFSCNM